MEASNISSGKNGAPGKEMPGLAVGQTLQRINTDLQIKKDLSIEDYKQVMREFLNEILSRFTQNFLSYALLYEMMRVWLRRNGLHKFMMGYNTFVWFTKKEIDTNDGWFYRKCSVYVEDSIIDYDDPLLVEFGLQQTMAVPFYYPCLQRGIERKVSS